MADSIQLEVRNSEGKGVSKRTLSANVFGVRAKKSVVHQTVRWQRAKKRAGTHQVKTRATISGGGVKPWKQKGTGRARAGSNRSPLWVGGGIAHGPKPRKYDFSLNKKERRLALAGILSARRTEDKLLLLDAFGLSEVRTKEAALVLQRLGIAKGESVLVVLSGADEITEKSLRNIAGVKVALVSGLNVYDVARAKYVLLVGKAVDDVEQRFANN